MEGKIRGLEKEKKELVEEKGLLEKEKKGLKEERGGMEEERNRLLTQNQEYQRSSQDHTSQIELLNAQLKLYESDFQKERDERERLVRKYDVMVKENANLKARLEVSVALILCSMFSERPWWTFVGSWYVCPLLD